MWFGMPDLGAVMGFLSTRNSKPERADVEAPAIATPPAPRDPDWQDLSTSLRESPEGGLVLYTKIPLDRMRQIIRSLDNFLKLTPEEGHGTLPELVVFLYGELKSATNAVVVYRLGVSEARDDADSIRFLAAKNVDVTPEEAMDYMRLMYLGLQNDESVDWITRSGGPSYISNPLIELETAEPTP